MTGSVLLALLAVAGPLWARELKPLPSRDRRIVKRWSIGDDPRGVAVGKDGTIYVGLAKTQSVVAIDPATGTVKKEVVLDSAEIASTKELVTMRIDPPGERLLIANGSDESATILGLPDLHVVREIGLEGETVRDVVASGKYLFVLGRTVHVFTADGEKEIRSLEIDEPMAIAPDSRGAFVAIVGTEEFGKERATVAAIYDSGTLREIARQPLQTQKRIESAILAASDSALIVVASDWLGEASIQNRSEKTMQNDSSGSMRIKVDFGDLLSSEPVCLPKNATAEILSRGRDDKTVIFAERQCGASGSFTASPRKVKSASVYGIDGVAIALTPARDNVVVTESNGSLTIFRTPVATTER